MKKITIHKNELKNYLVVPGTYKLGEEKMVRWVDVPEYLQVQEARTLNQLEEEIESGGLSDFAYGYQQGLISAQKKMDDKKHAFPKKLEDTSEGVRLVDFGTTQHEFNVLIEKINEIIDWLKENKD